MASSLPDKNFAKYVVENKLCIHDKKLIDLEIKFLQEPKKYGKDLLDNYIKEVEASAMYSDVGKELRKIPEVRLALNESNQVQLNLLRTLFTQFYCQRTLNLLKRILMQ